MGDIFLLVNVRGEVGVGGGGLALNVHELLSLLVEINYQCMFACLRVEDYIMR